MHYAPVVITGGRAGRHVNPLETQHLPLSSPRGCLGGAGFWDVLNFRECKAL